MNGIKNIILKNNQDIPLKNLKIFYIWGIKIFIFLIPLLPLYVSPSMVFQYVTGKNFAFRILVEFSAVLWVGLMVLSKEHRLRSSNMFLLILTFTFIVGLADLVGVNPYNSFWSNYEYMEGYLTILHLALYFMIIKSILITKKDWMGFLNVFFIAGVGVSLYALFQRFGPPYAFYEEHARGWIFRVDSTIGNPALLASYLLLIVFVGLILISNIQKTYLRIFYLFCIVLNSMAIYFTATRGTFLATFIGVIFFSLFYIFGKPNTLKEKLFKRVALSVFGLCIILSSLFWFFGTTDFIQKDKTFSRFATAFSDPSVMFRLKAWEVAWAGIKERPVLGWGQENFISVYTINPPPFGEALMVRPHNIILEWLINAGFLGFFSYLAIFCYAFHVVWKTFRKDLITKTEAVILITALTVYFIQNLFIFDTINTYLIFFALLAYIDKLDWNYSRKPYLKTDYDIKKLKVKSIGIMLLALLVFSITTYFINYKPIRQSQLTAHIISSFPNYRSFLTLLEDCKKALLFKTFGDTNVRLIMATFSDVILKHKLFEVEGALKFVRVTAEELEKLVITNFYNLKYWTLLINLYNAIAVYEPSFIAKAEAFIKECMRLSPKNQWIYLAMADNFVIKKDYENAFKAVKKAATLGPENDAIQLKLALAGILTWREKVLKNALENVKKIRMLKDNEVALGKKPVFSIDELLVLAQASMEAKNFTQALQFYKEVIGISPEEAKYHFDIAKIYLLLGDKVNALKEAKKAVELDPINYTEKAEKLINFIKELSLKKN